VAKKSDTEIRLSKYRSGGKSVIGPGSALGAPLCEKTIAMNVADHIDFTGGFAFLLFYAPPCAYAGEGGGSHPNSCRAWRRRGRRQVRQRNKYQNMNDLGHNSQMTALNERAIVLSEANSGLPLKGDFERMARRRYQSPKPTRRGEWWTVCG
jgi:hypothetical protein